MPRCGATSTTAPSAALPTSPAASLLPTSPSRGWNRRSWSASPVPRHPAWTSAPSSLASNGSATASRSSSRSFPRGNSPPPTRSPRYGLHGALFIGETKPAAAARTIGWKGSRPSRSTCSRTACCRPRQGRERPRRSPSPPSADLVDMLARDPVNPPIAPGEIVTTGTLTRALPVAPARRGRRG